MIKALIFDLDGTLADTEMLHYISWRDTLLAHGVAEFSFETFSYYIGTSNEKVASDYIGTFEQPISPEQLIAEKQNRYLALTPQISLYHGAKEIITQYKDSHMIGLATSSHHKEAVKILEEQQLISYFNEIVCGDMVKMKKPDPEIYLKTANMIGTKPSQCLAFEDTEHGLNAAKNAGMTAIAVPNIYTTKHDFSRADLILSSLNKFSMKAFE